MITKTIIKPRYAETDQMGVIHHAVYPVWYEIGRIELCENLGLPFHEVERRGIYMAMVSLKSEYYKTTIFGKTYMLHTKLVSMSKVRFCIVSELYDEDQVLCHRGETVLAWLDHDLKPMNIRRKHLDVHERFMNALEQKTS